MCNSILDINVNILMWIVLDEFIELDEGINVSQNLSISMSIQRFNYFSSIGVIVFKLVFIFEYSNK